MFFDIPDFSFDIDGYENGGGPYAVTDWGSADAFAFSSSSQVSSLDPNTSGGGTFTIDDYIRTNDLAEFRNLPPAKADAIFNFLDAIKEDPNLQDDIDRAEANGGNFTHMARLEVARDFLLSYNKGYYDDVILALKNAEADAPAVNTGIVVLLSDHDGSNGYGGGSQNTYYDTGTINRLHNLGSSYWQDFYSEYGSIF